MKTLESTLKVEKKKFKNMNENRSSQQLNSSSRLKRMNFNIFLPLFVGKLRRKENFFKPFSLVCAQTKSQIKRVSFQVCLSHVNSKMSTKAKGKSFYIPNQIDIHDGQFSRNIGICALPPVVGNCPGKGRFDRFFFNTTTKTCQKFTYSGELERNFSNFIAFYQQKKK